jgi:diguanylate cyclase (GGDEF)-like protein/PAS domain S-box-containing protein
MSAWLLFTKWSAWILSVCSCRILARLYFKHRSAKFEIESHRLAFFDSPVATAWVGRDGKFLKCNPAMERLVGYSARELLSLTFQDITHPDDLSDDMDLVHAILSRARPSYTLSKRYIRKDRQVCYVQISVFPLFQNAKFIHFVVKIIDRNAEQAAIDDLTRILNSTGDIVLVRDRSGRCMECWQTTPCMIATREELLGQGLEVLPSEVADKIQIIIRRVLDSGIPQSLEYPLAALGGQIWLDTKITKIDDDRALLVGRDISDRKRLEQKLIDQANHDSLTGVWNRRVSRVFPRACGCLYCDLDGFKAVNEGLGHAAGDLILKEIAVRLSEFGITARMGGDEFIVLFVERADLPAISAQIVEAIRQPFVVGLRQIRLDISIGIAESSEPESTEILIGRADLAEGVAKKQSKDGSISQQLFIYGEELEKMASRSSLLGIELSAAISSPTQLFLHYQPIVRASDGAIAGCEALIRWQHPTLGMVPPGEFIEVAEHRNLIGLITKKVIQMAISQARQWIALDPHFKIAINISAQDLENPQFLDQFLQVLEQHAMPPQLVVIEVTERSLSAIDQKRYLESLRQVSSIRAKISIDDFGSGESNLEHLSRVLPFVSELKLDQSFLPQSQADSPKVAITRWVTALSANLGLVLVTEGVETAWQRQLIHHLNPLGYAQGYYFSRPVPPESITEMLAGDRVLPARKILR